MTVATLENCKRLYKLSGWGDADKWYCLLNDHSKTPNYELEDSPIVADYITNGNIPAYDLGYLLDKLPKMLKGKPLSMLNNMTTLSFYYDIGISKNDDGFRIHADVPTHSNTPVDNACLLAIKLFEEGILKK